MFLRKSEVKKIVKDKSTKFATVIFLKKDGSVRKINGLFRPTSKMVSNARGRRTSAMLKENNLIPIFCVSEMAWKSFKIDRVLNIN